MNLLQILQNQEQLILNKLDLIADNKKKIEVLSVMNSELLQKLKYHEYVNFIEFQNNINNYFTSFVTELLNYFISDYYLNILKNIQQIY